MNHDKRGQGTQGDERRAYNVRSHFYFFVMSTNCEIPSQSTSPENEPTRSFSGLQLFWPPPALKTSTTARFRGFYLSLATTSPENECNHSSSGFQPLSGHHKPRKRARVLVFGVSIFLWPARAHRVMRGGRTTLYVRIFIFL